ncbi:LLM class flavin-dependent oxidoreductase [Intrasporangium mesophilum]
MEAARTAEQSGLDEMWLWEDCFLEAGISTAAIALASTDRLAVGVGVLPVPLRNVALTAMEIATLDRVFPGRFAPAVGHGVQDWMQQVGERVASPLTLMREYFDALSRLLAGERVTTHGRYVRLDGVALGWPPPVRPLLFMGAEGPRSLKLSGELSNGTVLTSGTSPDDVRAAAAHISSGSLQTMSRADHAVIAYIPAAFGPNAEGRLAKEAERWGWPSASTVGVAGPPIAVAEALSPWIEAGVNRVVLQPTQDEVSVGHFIENVGEVAALVRKK